MSRSKLLWIVVALLTLATLTVPLIWSNAPQWVGIALGGATLVALLLLYFAVIKPITTVIRGIELLHGQDFSSRLAPVGQIDADNIVALFNNLMSRLRQERLRQHEQNSFLSQLIDATPTGVLIFDFDRRVSRLNTAACHMLGVSSDEAIGQPLESFRGRLAAEATKLSPGESITVNLNNGGNGIFRVSRLWFMDMGFQREFILIDLLTNEVRRAEKATFSKMVRLMAHEVNNTMGGILTTLETLHDIHPADDSDDIAELLESCAERCSTMSRFITAYADVVKIPEPRMQPVDLGAMVSQRHTFLESVAKSAGGTSLRLTVSAGPDAVIAQADSVLMEQVLVNLIKNAAESIAASPRRGNGHIEIAVSSHPATITVTDNGTGITAAEEEYLFTPLHTTKQHGQGLGLLCITDILEKHLCTYSLTNRPTPQPGAIFRITFPAVYAG